LCDASDQFNHIPIERCRQGVFAAGIADDLAEVELDASDLGVGIMPIRRCLDQPLALEAIADQVLLRLRVRYWSGSGSARASSSDARR
jgi:hypothetical protein